MSESAEFEPGHDAASSESADISEKPRNLRQTAQEWTVDAQGNYVFDTPIVTGTLLDSNQGKVANFWGTCGLCSCENILRLAGVRAVEYNLVNYAATNNLCAQGHADPCNNGGTSALARQSILEHYGLHSFLEASDADLLASYVEQGRGVIISVEASDFYHDSSIRGGHAVTLTSTKRDSSGKLLGFYLCDSNNRPTAYYTAEDLARSMAGRYANVTTEIIR